MCFIYLHLSCLIRKSDFCICENKDADQLRSDGAAHQRLCFLYTDSTIPLLPKSEISSLWPSYVTVQPGLCRTRSETPMTGFLTTRLNSFQVKCVRCVFRTHTGAGSMISVYYRYTKTFMRTEQLTKFCVPLQILRVRLCT